MKMRQTLHIGILLSTVVTSTLGGEHRYADTIKSIGQAHDDARAAIKNGDYTLADSILTELEGMNKKRDITKRMRAQLEEKNREILLVQTADNLENRLRRTEQHLVQARDEIKELEQSLSASHQTIAAHEVAIDTRENTIAQMTDAYKKAQKENSNLQQRVAVLETEKQSMQEASSFEPTLNKIATTLDEKYDQLMSEKKECMQKVAILEHERSELQKCNQSLAKERSAMRQKIAGLENERSELQANNKILQQERTSMHAKIEGLEKEKLRLAMALETKKEPEKMPAVATVVADANNKICQAH